ncbi:MAG: hypothetical protein IKM00_06600 [Clostridia bacterium]|nr:hypothetical protein [Clostridia bacterium]
MGKRYKKRRKPFIFRKINLSRNAKMWIVLGIVLALLFVIARIAKLDILADIAAALIFTAPIVLANHQFANGDFFERTKKHNVLIYIYVALMFLIGFCPSIKIRWLLSFAYFVACGIYLMFRVKGTSFEFIMDEGDTLLLSITEFFMLLMIIALPVTTEINALGWILTAILSLALFLPIAYWIGRELSISLIKKIGINLCALFMIFVLCGIAIEGLNYSLDFSEPTVCSTQIDEKEHHNTSKGSDRRSFTVYMAGEYREIEVTSDVYKKYEKGENIDVNIHKGILGMTYYTIDE